MSTRNCVGEPSVRSHAGRYPRLALWQRRSIVLHAQIARAADAGVGTVRRELENLSNVTANAVSNVFICNGSSPPGALSCDAKPIVTPDRNADLGGQFELLGTLPVDAN